MSSLEHGPQKKKPIAIQHEVLKDARGQWPRMGQHIVAQFTDDAVLVYQAFNAKIATYAAKHNKFVGCPDYSVGRMTWIKTGFLWMVRGRWTGRVPVV